MIVKNIFDQNKLFFRLVKINVPVAVFFAKKVKNDLVIFWINIESFEDTINN